jgi:hypothetical protein
VSADRFEHIHDTERERDAECAAADGGEQQTLSCDLTE